MKRALVVGLNNYPNGALDWCDNDAIAMASLLETNGDGSPDFDVIKIIDSCGAEELNQAIQTLFATDADIALLYFSGHGTNLDSGYLVTTDCSSSCKGVRMSDVLKLANESPCKNRVIILDCCYAGKMGESFLWDDTSILKTGVTIMAASLPLQAAVEDPEPQHGIFTNLLIQGLRGGAADISGNITPASLYSFVDQSLGAWDQRPVFKTNITEFLAIRTIEAKVSKQILRKLSQYFKNPSDQYHLDPSYEFSNDPNEPHFLCEPFANPDHVAIFKELQLFASVGLVEPVDAEYMYYAAINSKACRLTALGLHYWRLSKNRRF
jgi:hypothetical protein